MKTVTLIITFLSFFSVCFLYCQSGNKKSALQDEKAESQNGFSPMSEQDSIPSDPSSMTFRMKLWQRGVDFYARGNEPFWALDIDFDGMISFQQMDEINIELMDYEIHRAQDENVIRIRGGTSNGALIITIGEEECTDTMSGERFRNTVNLEVKTSGMDDARKLSGCGQYVPDYALNDIWVLETLNGKPIDPETYKQKGQPVFEFKVEEGRVSGHAGCNNFNGGFFIAAHGIIHFEPFAMTRMMCENMDLEDLIASSVAGNRMKYQIENLELTLSGYDGTELIFTKVD